MHACVPCVCSALWRPEEVIASSGTGVTFVSCQVVLGTESWFATKAASALNCCTLSGFGFFAPSKAKYLCAHMRKGTEEEPCHQGPEA